MNRQLILLAIAFAFASVTLVTNAIAQTSDSSGTLRSVRQDAEDETESATTETTVTFRWLGFPDNSKFKVMGLHWFEQNKPELWRMPKTDFDSLPRGVKRRARTPVGARIVMRSNTSRLGLRVLPLTKEKQKGFDVYLDGKFFRSAGAEEPKVQKDVVLFKDLEKKEREITVYLPHLQDVLIKSIGVDEDTTFTAPSHKFAQALPVVFYGSSVCQGSGAARPAMTYPAMLCRELNLDFVSLGFGGAGKAEKNVVDLVTIIPACCFVFDLGKSYGMQDSRAYADMLVAARKQHPNVPMICITPITSSREVLDDSYSRRSQHARAAVREAVDQLLKSGERKLLLVEGTDLLGFADHDGLSSDGVHPSDYGYSLITHRLKPTVVKALSGTVH